jgi:AraC-like DNA-binding protein
LFPFQPHELVLAPDASAQRIIFNDHLILTVAQSVEGMIPRDPVFRPKEEVLAFGLKMLFDTFGENSLPISRIAPFEDRMRIKGLLYMLLGDFLASTTLITAPKVDMAAMDVALYIAENFQNNISLKDIAKEKGYNYQYLSRTFNRHMHMNFKKMLNFYRIHQAFAMLQDTDLPISRIAFECGFKSVAYFSITFKKYIGINPSSVRSVNQKKQR